MTQDPSKRLLTEANAAKIYPAQIVLPASNGVDDTATLNALLATAGGKSVRGLPGASYLLTAPLVLPSGGNVVLDMTGCTITLKPGLNVNLLNNAAVTPQRTVNDAAMTSGAANLTSATAAFTSADVGRWVKVAGAAVGGDLLVARVLSVTSATVAVLETAASTTVSAKRLDVHTPDVAVTLIGGRWDHGNAGGSWSATVNDHAIRLRFIQRLSIRGMTHTSTGGKYAISLAGVQDVHVDDHFFDNTYSDGVHIAGPAYDVDVLNLSGSCGDDMFAITSQEPTGFIGYNDCLGTVRNITVTNVHKTSGVARVAHVCYGRSSSIYNVRLTNIRGGCSSFGVFLWSDTGAPGGTMNNIVLDGVHIRTVDDVPMVQITEVVSSRIELRNVHKDKLGTTSPAIRVEGASVIDEMIVNGLHVDETGGTSTALDLTGSAVMKEVTVNDLSYVITTNGDTNAVTVGATAVITRLTLSGKVSFASGNCYAVKISGTSPKVKYLTLHEFLYENTTNSGGLIQVTGATGLDALALAQVVQSKGYWVGDLNSPCSIHMNSFKGVGQSGSFNGGSSFSGIVHGAAIELAGVQASGGTLRSKTFAFSADLSASLLNGKTAGDMVTNTNAALSCGAGPVVYTGTAWKSLATGNTY